MELTRDLLLDRRARLTTALSEFSGALAILDELLEYEAQAVVSPTPEESEEG